jgi:SAM-dependent methyltransferase
MPDLLKSHTGPWRKLMGLGFHLFDLAAYEFLYRLSPARNLRFFNSGYLPLADDLLIEVAPKNEAPSAMMYHLVARTLIGKCDPEPTIILDVGCGQGGGILYLSRLFPSAQITGTDRNRSVVKLANKAFLNRVQLKAKVAIGTNLGFKDDSMDLVLSVGAPTYFGLKKFVAEAARVVSPGGTVAFSAGYRQGNHRQIETEIRTAAKKYGLDFLCYKNITPNTFASLRADIPRREKLLKRVPWPFRLYGNKWADLPGSAEYDEYETGKRADFAVVLKAPNPYADRF